MNVYELLLVLTPCVYEFVFVFTACVYEFVYVLMVCECVSVGICIDGMCV